AVTVWKCAACPGRRVRSKGDSRYPRAAILCALYLVVSLIVREVLPSQGGRRRTEERRSQVSWRRRGIDESLRGEVDLAIAVTPIAPDHDPPAASRLLDGNV